MLPPEPISPLSLALLPSSTKLGSFVPFFFFWSPIHLLFSPIFPTRHCSQTPHKCSAQAAAGLHIAIPVISSQVADTTHGSLPSSHGPRLAHLVLPLTGHGLPLPNLCLGSALQLYPQYLSPLPSQPHLAFSPPLEIQARPPELHYLYLLPRPPPLNFGLSFNCLRSTSTGMSRHLKPNTSKNQTFTLPPKSVPLMFCPNPS